MGLMKTFPEHKKTKKRRKKPDLVPGKTSALSVKVFINKNHDVIDERSASRGPQRSPVLGPQAPGGLESGPTPNPLRHIQTLHFALKINCLLPTLR